MVQSRVTRRYAKALFEQAGEQKVLDRVSEDLKYIRKVNDESVDFRMLLSSPIIHSTDKKSVFAKDFKQKVHTLTFDFLILLLDKNREELLPEMIDFFMKLNDDAQKIIRARLITAHKFAAEQLKALKKQLDHFSGKNVILEQHVDSALLGGFIVRLDDTVIDTSLRNQLAKLRESMVSTE